MLNFKSNITYYLSSTPTDMRKSREGLAGVVREKMQRDPYTYGDAFIFYSKDLKKVKILHYDINGFVIYAKWFDDGRFLSPYFQEARSCHRISRELMDYLRVRLESVFRHILKTRYAHISEQVRAAMGRRCWLNSGSHDAAQNIAFMYSLYESCKMNDIDFGEYVEDILTRMMNGDDDYRSMIPCNYTFGKSQKKKAA